MPQELSLPKRPSLPDWFSKFFTRKGLPLLFFLLLLVGLGAFFFYSGPGKAEIEIWPISETINFKQVIIVDSEFSQPDPLIWLKQATLPGRLLKSQDEVSRQFSATGKTYLEKQAEGTIRVYNNYSTSATLFVANTRFISADGKLFRSIDRITVPGAKQEEGKLEPGFVDIKVIAAEPGEDYNIGPSTFSIPGLLGTPMYTAFYAKSFSAMQGGLKREVAQVRKEDLLKAQDELKKELLARAPLELKERCAQGSWVFLEDFLLKEVAESSCSAKEGDSQDSFECQVKMESKLLTFKESDLEKFSEQLVLSQLDSPKKIQPDSLKISYSLISLELEKGKVNLNLKGSAKAYLEIEEDFLKKGIAGKSGREALALLEDYPIIEKARIKLWPFWVKTIPKNLDKIKIQLNFED